MVETQVTSDILSKIGNTPLREMKDVLAGQDIAGIKIYAKLEWYNASGSVKARPALRMIEDGEKSGKLTPGKVILDSTSGNTGVAYALIGMVKGYKVKLVMPAHVCRQRKGMMAEKYKAELVFSDPIHGSDGAIIKAREIYNADPEKYFMPDQYNNPANWQSHYDTTAPEIWRQTDGKVTHFIAGLGTGGTCMGTGRGLKKLNPDIKVYGIQPFESLHGIEGLKHMPTSIVPGIYDESFLDGTVWVKTESAYDYVRKLDSLEHLKVGHSSGAAVAGAIQLAMQIKNDNPNAVIVTVFPDSCEECDVSHGTF